MIYAGFAPLIFFGLSLSLPGVESVEIDPVDEQLEVSRGDVVELTRTVTFRGGVGYVVLRQPAATRLDDAVTHRLQTVRAMGVRGDHDRHGSRAAGATVCG